jgi:hypothetical protein
MKSNWPEKFDIILMNPPYQAPKTLDSKGKFGKSIWEDFVKMSFGLLQEGGYCCHLHPSRWRKPNNKFGKWLKKFQFHYLELRSIEDGVRDFRCQTRYDLYIAQNIERYTTTTFVDESRNTSILELSMPMIPNSNIDEVLNMLASSNEEKLNLLYDSSSYHTQSAVKKGTLSRIRTDTHIFPCVYSIDSKYNVKCFYSSFKNHHFGVPKIIIPSGAYQSVGILIDTKGEYGLTQFAKAIVDDVDKLDKIAKSIKTSKFLEFYKSFIISLEELDKDVIKLFKKDFWKHFQDE